MDTLHFMVEVRATGWIGFGVATQAPTGMQNYDVAVGGVLSASGGYLKVECHFRVKAFSETGTFTMGGISCRGVFQANKFK